MTTAVTRHPSLCSRSAAERSAMRCPPAARTSKWRGMRSCWRMRGEAVGRLPAPAAADQRRTTAPPPILRTLGCGALRCSCNAMERYVPPRCGCTLPVVAAARPCTTAARRGQGPHGCMGGSRGECANGGALLPVRISTGGPVVRCRRSSSCSGVRQASAEVAASERFAAARSAACFTADTPTLLVLGPRQTATVARPACERCDWSAGLRMRKRDDHRHHARLR